MTVVVSDTSPLNYLVLIEEVETLHRLYDRVLIPFEVLAELEDAGGVSGSFGGEFRGQATKHPMNQPREFGCFVARFRNPGAAFPMMSDPL